MKRPFQFDIGIATQMRTLSPAGGCVVIAVTRHTLALFASTFADSIVVFGRATMARLSQVRTGFAFGIAGSGVLPNGGGVPRPPAGGAPLAPPCCAPLCITTRTISSAIARMGLNDRRILRMDDLPPWKRFQR